MRSSIEREAANLHANGGKTVRGNRRQNSLGINGGHGISGMNEGQAIPGRPHAYDLKRVILLSIFGAITVVLGLIEAMIPLPTAIPGVKLGLANIMVLTCLYYLNVRDALTLIALKTVLTALLLGTFSSFVFSLCGSLLSFAFMYLLLRFGRNRFSLTGVSVAGGVTHNIGQLGAAAVVLGTSKIYYYLPFLMLSGIVTGVFVGIAAKYMIRRLDDMPQFKELIDHDRIS